VIPAGLCCWGLQSTLQCAFGMSASVSRFIGLVVSVVEECVPDVRKKLPGSCAAVWGLQPERGDPSRGQALFSGAQRQDKGQWAQTEAEEAPSEHEGRISSL